MMSGLDKFRAPLPSRLIVKGIELYAFLLMNIA